MGVALADEVAKNGHVTIAAGHEFDGFGYEAGEVHDGLENFLARQMKGGLEFRTRLQFTRKLLPFGDGEEAGLSALVCFNDDCESAGEEDGASKACTMSVRSAYAHEIARAAGMAYP